MRQIELRGVTQNNLKNVDIDLPLGKSIVVTGPSGSGKSSLAFETVYAEGQRRYMQSLSTYARQFLERFRAPAAEGIRNIPPTIALEQLNPVRNSRATVGTTTEIYDYFRLFFEKVGIEYCEKCDRPMEKFSVLDTIERLCKAHPEQTLYIGFRRSLPKDKETQKEILDELMRNGYSRYYRDKQIQNVQDLLEAKRIPAELLLVLDRIKIPTEPTRSQETRMAEAIRNALHLGNDFATLIVESEGANPEVQDITSLNRCPKCKSTSAPRSSTSFSFNSPLGACTECKGFGNVLTVDPELVIPNPGLTLAHGAIEPFTKPSLKHWQKRMLEFCKVMKIDTTLGFRELPADQRKLIWEGEKKFPGVKGVFDDLQKEKYKMGVRVFVSRYTSPFLCKTCKGARLNASALRVKVGGKSIADLCDADLEGIQKFFKELSLTPRERKISDDILRQIERRLDYLITVGLGYLTLSRLSRSLSGGEYQRILLATQLSQGLTDTLYVLDEPSIGLHPKDTQRLLAVMARLRTQGNTLMIVEHDPEVIEWAEYVIDMGPGAGSRGGEVIFSGGKPSFEVADTPTARALKDWREQCRASLPRPLPENHDKWLEVLGASANNLQGVDVRIPLKCLVTVTGVSGSGKSTLVVDTLYQALSKMFHGTSEKIGRFGSIRGFEFLSGVELVDQTPIGKSSRSNPITFVKGYDEVRQIFASLPDASVKGLTPSHFSFNVPGGRCDNCEGEGRVRIDMVFMEDVFVPCQVCDEKRFKPHVLAVKYQGKNIDDVLRMTIEDAMDFFRNVAPLRNKLTILHEVGLGYLQLGQPGHTLSGGEAQRLKIARELITGTARQSPTLFILDEPTTGLHFNEIHRLISVFRRLISAGHSVLTIEHNVQLICASQYLIDLGPDGGSQGGGVVAVGSPLEVAKKKLPHTGRYLAEILGV